MAGPSTTVVRTDQLSAGPLVVTDNDPLRGTSRGDGWSLTPTVPTDQLSAGPLVVTDNDPLPGDQPRGRLVPHTPPSRPTS